MRLCNIHFVRVSEKLLIFLEVDCRAITSTEAGNFPTATRAIGKNGTQSKDLLGADR
jgi:hypothetical protein